MQNIFFIVVLETVLSLFDAPDDEPGIDDNILPVEIKLTKSEIQVSNNDVAFGINLFKDVYALENSADDILLSPFSTIS